MIPFYAAGAILATAIFAVAWKRRVSSAADVPKALAEDEEEEQLLAVEVSYVKAPVAVGTITSATFYRGDPDAASMALRKRLGAIVGANPWLAGSFVTSGETVMIRWKRSPTPASVDRMFNPTGDSTRPKFKPLVLHGRMSFGEAAAAVSDTRAEVAKANQLLNRPEQPLFAVSVVKDFERGADAFGVVISASHALMDGAIYYRLVSMLSHRGEITALSRKSKHTAGADALAAVGDGGEFQQSAGFALNMTSSILFGSSKKYTIASFLLDPRKVAALKEAQAGLDGSFVSTNDIISSAAGRLCAARVLLAACDMRQRVPGYDENDVGNYGALLAMGSEDFRTARSVRAVLKSGPPNALHYRRGTEDAPPEPFPRFWEAMRCRLALVTSWTFACFDELAIEGCVQTFHVPAPDIESAPKTDVIILYRPRPKELAVACFLRGVRKEQIAAALPVGDEVVHVCGEV